MSSSTATNQLTMNDAVRKAVAEATSPEQIRAALMAEAEKQAAESAAHKAEEDASAKAAADKAAADKAAAERAAADAVANQTFSLTETIGGRVFTFEASSQAELNEMVMNAYRVAYAVQSPNTEVSVDPAVEAAEAKKREEAAAAARAEADLKFKRGEISAADYIEQTGAMDAYLEKKGISVDDLKTAIEQSRTASYQKSWAEATEEFRNSPVGADWPGGPQNLQIIGMKIAQLGLMEATDKVAALARAYKEMKDEGLIFHPAASTDDAAAKSAAEKAAADKVAADKAAADKAAADKAAAERAAANTYAGSRPASSSLFGTSSGVATTTVKSVGDDKFEIPPNASPAEIMEIWKAQQLANGRNPNEVFTETFAAKRR